MNRILALDLRLLYLLLLVTVLATTVVVLHMAHQHALASTHYHNLEGALRALGTHFHN